jgi:hypothetical protein
LCPDDANNYEEEEPPGDEHKVRVDFINLIILADVEEEEGEDPDDEEDPLGQEDIVDEEDLLGQENIVDEEEEEEPPKIKRVGIDLRNDRILNFFNLNCTVKIVKNYF